MYLYLKKENKFQWKIQNLITEFNIGILTRWIEYFLREVNIYLTGVKVSLPYHHGRNMILGVWDTVIFPCGNSPKCVAHISLFFYEIGGSVLCPGLKFQLLCALAAWSLINYLTLLENSFSSPIKYTVLSTSQSCNV
jgi:hypothetical protein